MIGQGIIDQDLDPVLKSRIADVLAGMHESEQGRQAMEDYYRVSKFDALAGDALAALETAREFYELSRE